MDFIERDTETIAKDLLGLKIIYIDPESGTRFSGFIVETEAYLGTIDRASHSYNGRRTPRVESLYRKGGTIYAHVMHTHLLINFVAQDEDVPHGILIRGIEPDEGVEEMSLNRNKTGYDITNGPGKLTKAMNIKQSLDGTPINAGPFYIDEENRRYPKEIVADARIGIPNKGEWTDKPLRFTVKGNPYVSRRPKRDMIDAKDTWK
ncbi:DNA-3-methyladenine glycosylase [Staphylococcus massiliensis]|uniref:Putative 3-methyladenine DNA glycosylase n=1 Tax=Staphylococcus massiliensis S46 TaxID=1229783 RepID=K9B2K3_9STAP|nr:DNA-3-methyladenine glycosylase [Staphylococcus massiliensis]EKU49027.1 DNA-3-methyladenine glycosylase [Staphylococcus massiliensis S46]MCG3399470.1 DNA-3-methyladenine glycosylase [Staphylococcus massiliensis]MCG3402430.1 DNA-3-methyladenine glycosylase [Staphylococcus massiliensis]MCG3411606.1 DNA-3-methyladenine glycosylase [Staphylococcus massiliensis]PNZ99502.1 DNA-3-methyladenine glycosylase [Staphylococcus massiliensis CCUG 55927]